jgi:hypothetical protein
MRRIAVLAALVAAPALSSPALAAGELSAGAGIAYTKGDYGTGSETKILSLPFMARYDTDSWIFKATVPWLRVTGPSNVIPGVGRFSNKGSGKGRSGGEATESGFGDTVLSATYNAFYDRSSTLGLDLTTRLKLPTADENKGLGTGSTDVGFQGELYRTVDRITVFGVLGYTLYGDSDVVEQKNGFNYGIGASTKLDATNTVGASLDGRQRVVEGGAEQRELTFFLNHRIDRSRRIQAFFLVGLADGSPDVGLGVSALFSF